MDIVKIVSGFLAASNEDVDEATLEEMQNGKSRYDNLSDSFFKPRMLLGGQLFKTPFRYSYAELGSAVHKTGLLSPFVNVEPPASRTDGKLVWDYAPRLELDFGGLCSGKEDLVRDAIRFVDDRGLVEEADFADEPGLGPFRKDPDGRHLWFLPVAEQDRILRDLSKGDDSAGLDIGWTIVRFAGSILIAFARLGFVAHDFEWFERNQKKDDLTEDLNIF